MIKEQRREILRQKKRKRNILILLALIALLVGIGVLLVTQVFSIRLTPAVCGVMVAGMTAGYFAVALLRDWMLAALF